MESGLIQTTDLEMTFESVEGRTVRALSPVSFRIDRGEFITVIGPSGCGKTTLLRLLSGLLSPTAGEIRLAGSPVTGPRREISIVFQEAVLLPWRSVLENVLLPVECMRLGKEIYRERALALLEMVGLGEFVNHYPSELSGGMQQRNAIARALVTDPEILLMDEPFGALDALTREQMNLEILRIWSETHKTVFFITHSIAEAVFLADRIFVMTPRPGKIAEVMEVPLPRPRKIAHLGDPVFAETTRKVREVFQLAGDLS